MNGKMKKVLTGLGVTVFTALCVSRAAFAAPSTDSNSSPQVPSGQAPSVSATSSNWSGYIAQDATYTGVSATWIMPKLDYSSTLSSNATWIGIGGRSSGDLIQAGVYEIANADGATYQAWYELLPADSIALTLAVHPGDSISAAILETAPNVWNIVITNNTTGKQFEKTVTYQSSLSSAEWIQERPIVNGSLVPLSNYSPVSFAGATAIQNGKRVTLAQTNPTAISLIDTQNDVALAVPSPINADGMSFTDYRTSAVASSSDTIAQVPSTTQSIIPPYELHRTGHSIAPWSPYPSITWILHFNRSSLMPKESF